MAAEEFVVAPGAGRELALGGLGVVYKVTGAATGGAFAIVEHPLRPGALAGPPHTHAHEDEFSYVLKGRVGFLVGEAAFEADEGAYVAKPRGLAHTFWNPGAAPARIMEMIAPGASSATSRSWRRSSPSGRSRTSAGSRRWRAATV